MMHQGLDREVLVQEAWDRDLVLVQEAWDRGLVLVQEAWGRGLVLVQEAWDRDLVLVREAWDRGLVEEQRHSLQLVTQMGQNSHTWLGIMPVMFHRISFLCTLCTMIACPLVCCIHPNLPCSCNTFWRSPRPSIFH